MRFDTTLGTFDVRLFMQAAPNYSNNLLDYADDDSYVSTFVHRSIPQFILQGGGYFLDPDIFHWESIDRNDPVVNEPGISNIRNTISLAKGEGDPDSATSEWFFSVNHNTANLDNQNEGFTVFGMVLGDGMDVVDAIVALPRINAAGFSGIPVLDIDKVLSQQNIFDEDAVLINSVSVIDYLDGDYNFDGIVDESDLAVWERDYGRLKIIGGDFNDDKEMDSADLAIWESRYGSASNSNDYRDGDSNGDRVIDGTDFLAWQRGAGKTVDVAADGDGSAQIDGRDFLLWQRNYGASPLSTVNAVPEPSALVLLLLAALAKPQALRRVLRRSPQS